MNATFSDVGEVVISVQGAMVLFCTHHPRGQQCSFGGQLGIAPLSFLVERRNRLLTEKWEGEVGSTWHPTLRC